MSEATIAARPLSRREVQRAKRDLLLRLTLDLVAEHGEFRGTAAYLLRLFSGRVDLDQFLLLPTSPRGLALTMRSLYKDLAERGVVLNLNFRRHPYTRVSIWRITRVEDALPKTLGQLLADGLSSKRGGE